MAGVSGLGLEFQVCTGTVCGYSYKLHLQPYDGETLFIICEICIRLCRCGSLDVIMQAEDLICCLCTAVMICCWQVWLRRERDSCCTQQDVEHKVLLRRILHMYRRNQCCKSSAAELSAAVVWQNKKKAFRLPFSLSQRSMILDVSRGLATCTGVEDAPNAPLCEERALFAPQVDRLWPARDVPFPRLCDRRTSLWSVRRAAFSAAKAVAATESRLLRGCQ